MPHAPKCPECGLPVTAEEAPRSTRWVIRQSAAILVSAVLVLAYITTSTLRSTSVQYVANSGGALRVLPGHRATVDPNFKYLTVGDLRAIARGESALRLDVKDMLRMPTGYRGSDHLESDRFVIQVTDPLAGMSTTSLTLGWPLPSAWASTFRMYSDLPAGVISPMPAAAPVASWSWRNVFVSFINPAGVERRFGFEFGHTMAPLAVAAAVVAVSRRLARRSVSRPRRRRLTRLLVALVIAVGLGLPRSTTRTSGRPANAAPIPVDLTRGELARDAENPAASARIAAAIIRAIDTTPVQSFDSQQYMHSQGAAPTPMTHEDLVARLRSDAHAVLFVPGLAWPNGSVARASTTSLGSPLSFGEYTEVTADIPALNWPEPGASRLVRTHRGEFGWETRGASELRMTRFVLNPAHCAAILSCLLSPLIISTLIEYFTLNWSQARARRRHKCIGCGYDLAGLSAPATLSRPEHPHA